jgi:hypothetical protein
VAAIVHRVRVGALSVALAIAGVACTDGGETLGGTPTVSTAPSAEPRTAPAFRFSPATRSFVRTAPGPITLRHRRSSARAADAARAALTELYVEAFLDPANWRSASYEDAFGSFARPARTEAASRTELLTAGADAGERFDEIVPVSGRIATRILLDREGNPTLLVSTVRFAADALGAEPVVLRSTGQFFFERVGGAWKIVSFHVTRADRPREAS